jgi:cyclic beta-1,2-glucan synthetase
VRRDFGLIQLLDPPFDKGSSIPASIRGYVPGVRENGGQYTHAAIWTAMAFAKMGRRRARLGTARHDQSGAPRRHALTTARAVQGRALCGGGRRVRGVAAYGRGGWSWYTGSSGWMYRLVVESLLLGIERVGERLVLAPQLPICGWPGFRNGHFRVFRHSPPNCIRPISSGPYRSPRVAVYRFPSKPIAVKKIPWPSV